jgi:hypothetical protein
VSCCSSGAKQPVFERLEPRALFAVGALDVTIGTGAARSVRFVDGDGTAVSVLMSAATASVHFAGDGLAQTGAGRDMVVSGTAVTISGITATGTSGRSSLSITASGGGGRVSVGGINADGPLKRVVAPAAVLTGAVSAGGTVRRFQVLRVENGPINFGAGNGTSSVEITEAAVNVPFASGASVRRLTVGSWTGGAITAPSIGTATVRETFTGVLTAGSAAALVFSRLQNATINVSGPVRLMSTAGLATDCVINVGGDVRLIAFGVLERCRVYVGVRPLPPESPVPTSVADFVGPASVGRLAFNSFSTFDTVFAAPFIRRLFIGTIADIPPGGYNPHTFVAADRVIDFRGTLYNLSSQRPFHYKNLEHEVRQLGVLEIRAL